jgi:hypothetical protein
MDASEAEPEEKPATVRSVVIWSLVGLVFAFFTTLGSIVRTLDVVEVWRIHHPGLHGAVTDISACDYDDNYYVVCEGRFTADDGSVTGKPVLLMADFIHPQPPVAARIVKSDGERAWADDYEPEWGGWVFIALLTAAFSIGIFTGIALGIRSLIRRREAGPRNF